MIVEPPLILSNMLTFGITGSIAVGKSNVTASLRSYGIPIVDADIVSRQVVEPGSEALDNIACVFGKEYLNSEGGLDRTKLGNLVFSDPNSLLQLETIVSPLIKKESKRQIDNLHKMHSIVGYDAALIIENGLADEFRPLIVVHCPLDIQVGRLMKRNNLTYEQAMTRINSQLASEFKIKFADIIIDTSGSFENTSSQVFSTYQDLKKLNTRKS